MMLTRKMFREIKSNFGQFFSLFLLSFLAVALFATFKSSNTGAYKAMKKFHEECNLADGWPVSYTHLTLPTICSV